MPYAPSPMYCRLVYRGPTVKVCPRTDSECSPRPLLDGALAACEGRPGEGGGNKNMRMEEDR